MQQNSASSQRRLNPNILKVANPKYQVKIQPSLACSQNYYGENCDVHCKAYNDPYNGHYDCDQKTGAKICLPGWESNKPVYGVIDAYCNQGKYR